VWGCNVTYAGASDGMCGGMVQRAIQSARKVIVVDPRRIGPANKADHWLQVRPGTDGALALAMINVIIAEDLMDRDFVDNYTIGFESLVEHVRQFTPEWAETITRVPAKLGCTHVRYDKTRLYSMGHGPGYESVQFSDRSFPAHTPSPNWEHRSTRE
jgi:anaerobic selenocysteine-containing dehydrogenase